MTRDALARAAQALSPEERVDLIDEILQTLIDDEESGVRAMWAKEARERRDEVRGGVVEAIQGDQVRAEIEQLLRS